MTYIELINNFWQTRRTKQITSNEADLYFFLLNECNLRGWVNPFACPNGLICATIGMSEKTLIDVRNRLKGKGFIDYENGKRGVKPPTYTITYCNKVSTKVNTSVNTSVSTEVNTEVNTSANNIIKTKTKIKDKESIKEKTTRFFTPTIGEIESYCRERGNSVDASKFFNFYESKGWMVGKNKMKDWKASVRTWERSEQKQNNQDNGTHRKGTTKEERDAEFARHIYAKLGYGNTE